MQTGPALPRTDQLRAALCAFVAEAGTTRRLPVTVRLGVPGGEHLRIGDHASYDAGMRADLLTRALDGLELSPGCPGTSAPVAWLTRAGELSLTDPDLAWHAAARTAYARHGLDLPAFFVVTRRGWVDVASLRATSWVRVRPARMSRAARTGTPDPG